MKKMLKIGLLAVLMFSSVAVYADGNMSTGNRTCTENCVQFANGTTNEIVDTDLNANDTVVDTVIDWVSTILPDLAF